MRYREIRVRPVVRYIVTDFSCDEDYGDQKSVPFGEFDNVGRANTVAYALAASEPEKTVVEPARKLRIDWFRGPGEPQEAIRWELTEVPMPAPQEPIAPNK